LGELVEQGFANFFCTLPMHQLIKLNLQVKFVYLVKEVDELLFKLG
jgi:hypothetical protein